MRILVLLVALVIVLVLQLYYIREDFAAPGRAKYLDKSETYACTKSLQAVSFKPDEIEWVEELIPRVNAAIKKYYPGVDNSPPWILGLIELAPDFAQVYDNSKIILSTDIFDKYYGWDCMLGKILLYMRLGILYGDTEFLRMPWAANHREWQYALRYVNCGAFSEKASKNI